MASIKPYNVSTQSNDSSAPKGSINNPYTQDEFYKMLDEGTWTGGYVVGMGYVFPEVTVTGSSNYDSDSWSDPWGSASDPWGSTGEDKPAQPSGGGGGGSGNNDGENCNTSTNVPDVLPISAFSGYKASEPSGCLNRCCEMLEKAHCKLNGKEIAMTHYDSNGRATTATDDFNNGLNYIDGQLQQNKPVIVAVDYKEKTSMGGSRLDQAGDHFVIIVGGSQTHGYHYYDPATSNQDRGTSSANIFKMHGDLMKSTNTCTGSTHNYILTSIRENK